MVYYILLEAGLIQETLAWYDDDNNDDYFDDDEEEEDNNDDDDDDDAVGVEQNRKQETSSFQKLLALTKVISGKCMHSRYPHKTLGIKNSC